MCATYEEEMKISKYNFIGLMWCIIVKVLSLSSLAQINMQIHSQICQRLSVFACMGIFFRDKSICAKHGVRWYSSEKTQ